VDWDTYADNALKSFAEATTAGELAEAHTAWLGRRSELKVGLRNVRDRETGMALNAVRERLEEAFAAREAELERAVLAQLDEQLDVTLPGLPLRRGRLHPLTQIRREVEDIFLGLGYEIVDSREVETVWHNFDALNIAPDHPARTMMDTFYVASARAGTGGSGLVLRTHTSPVQARTMLTRKPPIYVVCPGRVYRTDELDATHTPVFHQVEGLVVDKGITMAHLKGTLDHFARAMFGPEAATRLRPSYFPFTEPSAELDLWFPQARGGARWIEWGGCGMVNPRVLRSCGVDPDLYSGFAFGMGIERTLMFRHGVTDMRDMVEGDVRFTRAFGMEV